MNLVERVKNIVVSPKEEWPKIAGETETPQSLYLGYIVILAAIGPLATVLRTMGAGVIIAIAIYVTSLVITFVLALIVDALAPSFGGEKNFIQSLKLTAYAYTAAWVAGIFHLIPVLGGVIGLVAAIYAWYTFYLGAPVMKKVSQEKAIGYTIVVVICGILLGVVLAGVLLPMFVGGSMIGMNGVGLFH